MNVQYISGDNGKPAGVFITMHDWDILKKKLNCFDEEINYVEPTKEEILEGIKQAVKELSLIKKGKLKARPLKDLLNEL